MAKRMIANMAPADLKMIPRQGDSATFTWPTPVCALVKGACTQTAGGNEGCSARRSEPVRPGIDHFRQAKLSAARAYVSPCYVRLGRTAAVAPIVS